MTDLQLAAISPSSPQLSALLARMSELDQKIRSIDPHWVGLDAGSFASALSASGANSNASLSAASIRSAFASAAPFGAASGSGQTMVEPVPGATVSQPYGPTSLALEPPATVDGISYAHFHDGLDLAAPLGTPVRAAADGTVVSAGRTSDGAVVVSIRHADGTETRYGHLAADLDVKAGDAVTAGQVIGSVGLTGNTTGPHLHFELWSGGRAIDPAPWLASGHLPAVASAPGSSGASSASGTIAGDGAVGALTGAVRATAGTASDDGSLSSAGLARFDAVASQIPYGAEIRSSAVAAGVDPLLLASLVNAESGFRAAAVSSAGAEGLTQLMPATARSLGVTEPFDPAQNLQGGARYLASDLQLYGRVDLALAAYQAGKGAVAAAGGVPNYPSTRNYIATILGTWSRYLKGSKQ